MSRSAGTLDRLERILAMVPWLLDHPGSTIADVTTRFGISRDELTADLDVLGYCGLPGYGGGDLVEASIVGDRVVVRMADFFRRPLRLSMREAITLLLAARALSSVAALPESTALRRAEGKLVALLGAAAGEAPTAGAAGPGITVDLTAPGDELLPALRNAIEQSQVLLLSYRSGSKAELSQRAVEPWALTGALGSWYLQAYCRKAQAPRAFRIDRIREIEVTEEVAERRPAEAVLPAYQAAPDDEQVVLDLARRAWWVAEWAVVEHVQDRGDVRRVTLRTARREWIARLVLSLGDAVTVVGPADLGESVAALARSVLKRYR